MKYFFFLLLCIGLISPAKAQNLQLDSTLLHITVAIDSTKITAPWDIEWGFDNRLWMTDAKTIKAWNPVTGTMKQLIRFPKGNGMGLAVPKTMPSSGPVFVYAVFDTNYYYAGGALNRVYRFVYDPVYDSLVNPTIILSFPHLSEHSGGKIIIAADGKLMVTSPEYTYANDTIGARNGRVLRLNTDGSIPAGNYRPDYTYTIGHRNPQGMVLLPDGKILSTEHSGPATYDEVNLVEKGGNYGWPAMEGFNHCTNFVADSCVSSYFTSHHHKPVYEGPLTPGGLDYYDHPAIPEWRNCLIVATLYQPDSCLAVLKMNANHDSVLNRRNYLKKYGNGINSFGRTRDICVAPDGSIYCIIKDRSFTNVGDSLINISCKIVRIKNDAYVPPINGLSTMSKEDGIHLYPNPANEYMVVEMAAGQWPVAYKIADMQGKVLAEGIIDKARTYLTTNNLATGAYQLIFPGINTVPKRFVVMR